MKGRPKSPKNRVHSGRSAPGIISDASPATFPRPIAKIRQAGILDLHGQYVPNRLEISSWKHFAHARARHRRGRLYRLSLGRGAEQAGAPMSSFSTTSAVAAAKTQRFESNSSKGRSWTERCSPRLPAADCRYVFHQAALGSVPRSVEQPRLYHDVNTTGDAERPRSRPRRRSPARVMFAASSSAYGDNPVPWIETIPPMPKSPYAATKLAGEALLRAYAASYGLDTPPCVTSTSSAPGRTPTARTPR